MLLNQKGQPLTLVFVKAGRMEAVFQHLFFNLASYRQDVNNLALCKSSTFIYKFSLK